ncbi:hypothetical protein DC1_00051 [Burkholderia phage DC1]|uniref:Uncharacterized protein n=1 Tax=Burkholderia phage DC1 TaxID=2881398 RepID=I6NML5_9CAUD|nr:structural protein [Burkholderia phage DC1]AEZ50869.1 hypothetical protein DC1_00051 [Burkholderia phage DC1]
MPIAAADLIARAGEILQDEDHIRWEVPELLRWINDAARETIVRRPAARSVATVLPLAAGTRQEIPARGVELLDVVRNIGADGTTPGRIVRRVDRHLLDDQNPDWHAARPKNVVKHFTFDERAPRIFYVYPPAVAGTKVETLHSELPPDVKEDTDSLDMGAEYVNVLVSYICYRALSKDSEFANGTVAALHYQAFVDAVSDNNQQTTANSPNANHV